LINKVSDHLTVSYNYAKLIGDSYSSLWTPRSDTKFKSWTFTLNNIDWKSRPSEREVQKEIHPKFPISIITGINIADVRINKQEYKEKDIKAIKMNPGYKIGIESKFGLIITGIAFDQRGANYLGEAKIDPDIHLFDFNIIDNYNYVSLYGLLSIPVIKRIRIFSGIETGDCIRREMILQIAAGELSDENIEEHEDLPPTNINWDYGLKVGADFMIFKSLGLRAAYYHGFNYVFKEVTALPNNKHRNIEFSLIYQL
ncbi:MAG TPA: hypothetical protein PLC51_09930, partial [Candidatus Marinimicrobia bacterium]|nr:hypothetical protein [Candidatus Neomarinimicrobiota bacterium]